MKKKIVILICIITSLMLSGCTIRKTQVSYTVYPVGYILNRLAREQLQIQTIQDHEIVQRSSLVEDYQEILEGSEVLFQIGTLEPYLLSHSNAIAETSVATKDLSSMNAIYKFQRYTPVIVDGDVTFIESAYYRGEAFDTIDIDERDLYLWIDPIAMLSMAKDIKNWLVRTYPEDEVIFEEKFLLLENDLVQLDAEFQKLATLLLDEQKEIKFVSMTPTYGSWQKNYGFQIYPVILSKYGALPTEEQIEIIKQRIIADNVQYIVYEDNMPEDIEALFDRLQEELDLTVVNMNDLSSLSANQVDGNKDYLSLMYENLASLEMMAQLISTGETEDNVTSEDTENKTDDTKDDKSEGDDPADEDNN